MSTVESESKTGIASPPTGKQLAIAAMALPIVILVIVLPVPVFTYLLPDPSGPYELLARGVPLFSLLFMAMLIPMSFWHRYSLKLADIVVMVLAAAIAGNAASILVGWAIHFLAIDVAASSAAYISIAVAPPVGAGLAIYWFERRWRMAGREKDPFLDKAGNRLPDAPSWEPLAPGALMPSPLFGFSAATVLFALTGRLNLLVDEFAPMGGMLGPLAAFFTTIPVVLGLPLSEVSPRNKRHWVQLVLTLYVAFLSFLASIFSARFFLMWLTPEGDPSFLVGLFTIFVAVIAVAFPLIPLFLLSLENMVRPGGWARDIISAKYKEERETEKRAGLAPAIVDRPFPRILYTFLPLAVVLIASQIAYLRLADIFDLTQYLDVFLPLILALVIAVIARPNSFRHVAILAAGIVFSAIPTLLLAALAVQLFAGPVDPATSVRSPLKLIGSVVGAMFVIAVWAPIILVTRRDKLWVFRISQTPD